MSYSIIGKVYRVGATEQVSDKFSKRELILEVVENPQYPQYPCIEFVNAKCQLLDTVSVGSDVQVKFSVEGRQYNDRTTGAEKFFTKLSGFAIERVGAPDPVYPQSKPGSQKDDMGNDLPF